MTREEALARYEAAGLTTAQQRVMLALETEEPRPTYRELAVRLDRHMVTIQSLAGRARRRLYHHAEEQAAAAAKDDDLIITDDEDEEPDPPDHVQAQHIFDAIRGEHKCSHTGLSAVEGDRDRVNATRWGLEDVKKVVRTERLRRERGTT